ncbi:insulin-degrading enzyme-like [Pogonomyrmex barbatus]|uniref:Insulin-degrading enzyme-like n=1 Tax=Pogonomyrmex barbatus TaxID=144034 RepID=A0A6I9W3Q1_9HYME|nr:insulin-degrading enzyme-like [Pogonomyrmex barbatus]
MIFHLVSPIAHMDPLHSNLTHLLLHLVNYSLKEYATIAGLQWNLNTSDYGIIVSTYIQQKRY